MKITTRGWPWQTVSQHWSSDLDKTRGEKYGWNPLKVKGAGRFGGWWAFKLGVTSSSDLKTWIFDLVIGSITIKFGKKGE
jgi:hypothetical protein